MQNPPVRKIFTVFLASPTDLIDHRRAAKEEVDTLNEALRGIGWEIDLLRFEDVPPGAGRPQDLINPDLDRCDLFLGVLWCRWGQPTGTYSSGFEEEVERVLSRRERDGTPQIWLFFQKVGEDQSADAGPQLSQVLEFRKRVEQERRLFYKEFTDADDWRKLLRAHLLSYVLRAAALASAAENRNRATRIATAEVPGVPMPSDAHREALGALDHLYALVTLPESQGQPELLARAVFVALAAFGGVNAESLGAGTVAALYRSRKGVSLTPAEIQILALSIIWDAYGVIAGWCWLAQIPTENIASWLWSVATQPDGRAAPGALRWLVYWDGPLPWSSAHFEEFIDRALLNGQGEVARQAATVLSRVGGNAEAELLQRGLEGTGNAFAAGALAEVFAKSDPEHAFAFVLGETRIAVTALVARLRRSTSRIRTPLLAGGLSDPRPEVRKFALEGLDSRGELKDEQARTLLADGSSAVRCAAYRSLVSRYIGNRAALRALADTASRDALLPSECRHQVLTSWLDTLPGDEVADLIAWSSSDGVAAYEYLVMHGNVGVWATLRADLDSGFERMRGEFGEQLRVQFGQSADALIAQWEDPKLVEFVRGRFTIAALNGLAEHGNPEDVALIRRFLWSGDWEVQRAAIRALGRLGGPDDANELIGIAQGPRGTLTEDAALGAIALAPGWTGAAKDLVEVQDTGIVRTALRAMWSEEPQAGADCLRGLLRHTFVSARRMGAAYLLAHFEDAALEDVLDEYLAEGHYYFDVLAMFDAALYAPEPIRAGYRSQVEQEVIAQDGDFG